MKERKERAPYRVRQVYRRVYTDMWHTEKKVIFCSLAEIVLNVAVPLLLTLLPPAVIGMLERGIGPAQFAWQLLLIFVPAGCICGAQAFINARNWPYFTGLRMTGYWEKINMRTISMDYALSEQEEVRVKMQNANQACRNNDEGIEGFMNLNVQLAINVLGLLIYMCIISSIHPLVVVVLLGLSAVQMMTYRYAKNYERRNRDQRSRNAITRQYIDQQVYEVAAGKDIRLYRLYQWLGRIYRRLNVENKELIAKEQIRYYWNDLAGLLLQFLRDVICYGYLLYLLTQGMEISLFVLYLGVISGFAGWFGKISDVVSKLSRCFYQVCDIFTYLDLEDSKGRSGKLSEGAPLDIVFDHVSFSYPGSEEKVLNDVSFRIRPGEHLALVGLNGAGKSTLVKLLCGLYTPTEGAVIVNGQNLQTLDQKWYFRQLAVIFQDPLVLSVSVEQNVSGQTNERMDRKRCQEALERAGLGDKIRSLPQGAGTYIHKDLEDGVELSGGEIQKLILARALYKQAKLLLLDEPTAAMDAIAEQETYEQYQKLLRDRSVLFISHRLASTRFCDQILLLKDGKIAEKGTHGQLMEQNGFYAELFKVQSRYYKEAVPGETEGCLD